MLAAPALGLAKSMANSLTSLTTTSAKLAAGGRANAISKMAQDAAANFNSNQSATANALNQENLAAQYGFNSGQAALANAYSTESWNNAASWNEMMWQRAADWNEKMMNKTMDFNREQAEIQRQWQERMSNTQYQRAIKDLKAAGLNPVLAATSGMSAGVGTGSAASIGGSSVGAPSMSAISGAMASGGLLGADSASISGYSGQLEYMGGILGMLGNAFAGIGSAVAALSNSMGESEAYKSIIKSLADIMGNSDVKGNPQNYDSSNMGTPGTYEYNYKKRWEGYWNRK